MASRVKGRRTWLGVAGSIAYADAILSRSPAGQWVERVDPVGTLVCEVVAPIQLCTTTNEAKRLDWRTDHGHRKRLLDSYIRRQVTSEIQSAPPLGGRPHIVCIRFSASRVGTDAENHWSKHLVDGLLPHKVTVLKTGKARVRDGIGLIADDDRASVRLDCWPEPGPRGNGFVLMRVYTGD